MGYTPYPQYIKIDSINLREVPDNWTPIRLRFVVESNPVKSEINFLPKDTLVSFVPMEAVSETGSMSLEKEKPLADVYNGYTFFRNDDVVLAKITPCFENGKGAVASNLTNGIGFGTTEFHVLRKIEGTDNRWLFYITKSDTFRKYGESEMYGAGGQKRVPDSFIKNFMVGFPSLKEQTQIANFLDHKTAQIDRLIQKKKQLIEKLNEKRIAVITHAVTKGLDPSVPMKDSGVDWLGEVPKHWEMCRLKHVTSKIIDGTHVTPTYTNDGIPFLRVTDIVKANNSDIDMQGLKYISEEEYTELSKRCWPQKGDLLYSKNGTIGVPRVIDWDWEFSIFVSLCLIKIEKNIVNPEYLSIFLQSKVTQNQIAIGSKSNTVTNLHLDKIKEFIFVFPPKKEQLSIIQVISEQIDKINSMKNANQRTIERLQEYRTALITAAVTGKIDVRDIPIPDQEAMTCGD